MRVDNNLVDKVSLFSKRLKFEGSKVSKKMNGVVSSMNIRLKELFQGPNPTDKLVEDATSENLLEPNWAMNLEICDMINQERISTIDLIRGIKKRLMMTKQQYLALVLLETCAKNCEKVVLDETDDLVQQCCRSQTIVQRIIENEAVLLEVLNVNEELVKTLSKYQELKKPSEALASGEAAMIPTYHGSSDDMIMEDLDEMIFGKRGFGI